MHDYSLTAPMWSGTPAAAATSDESILACMLEVEVALATALARHDAIPQAHVGTIRAAADPDNFDVRSIALRARGGGNPVIPLLSDLREQVRQLDPEAVASVHKSATSQDIVDSALMLVAVRAVRIILADLRTAAAGLASLADRHRSTVMAARTLTQQSVPTTFGLKAAGWLYGLTTAARRLERLAPELPAQLGGASGTLAATAQLLNPADALAVVDTFAAELGLLAPAMPWHTRRAPVTELGDALAGVNDALGKIAVDIALLSRTEIAEVAEPAAAGRGGSSAMPQKQNPVLSVLMNAAARKAPALAAELHRSALAVDERPDGAWHTEWSSLQELLRLVGGSAALAAELTPGLQIDDAKMKANLNLSGGLVLSERLMLELAPVLGKDQVQQLIIRAGAGEDLQTLLAAALNGADRADDGEKPSVEQLLDPSGYVGCSDAFIGRALSAYQQHFVRQEP
ncbi:class-II fumarase/aspartase family protein [Arthrobacter sp. H14]|uniref:class-II fumarase/aspartase family protein n=1 Tax=Arthrobacter sp. H14 TaxID=1312959 RepID=UPI0006842A97|nr:adenylosuccinate lyase family protein [Arthrobacter sp. H14]